MTKGYTLKYPNPNIKARISNVMHVTKIDSIVVWEITLIVTALVSFIALVCICDGCCDNCRTRERE